MHSSASISYYLSSAGPLTLNDGGDDAQALSLIHETHTALSYQVVRQAPAVSPQARYSVLLHSRGPSVQISRQCNPHSILSTYPSHCSLTNVAYFVSQSHASASHLQQAPYPHLAFPSIPPQYATAQPTAPQPVQQHIPYFSDSIQSRRFYAHKLRGPTENSKPTTRALSMVTQDFARWGDMAVQCIGNHI